MDMLLQCGPIHYERDKRKLGRVHQVCSARFDSSDSVGD